MGESGSSEDVVAIRRVLGLYCQRCDDGRFEAWAELFCEDATFTVMGTTHRGRAALRRFMQDAQPPERRGKHLLGEPVVEVSGDDARAWSDYSFVARVGDCDRFGITSVGRYHDHLRRDADGRWRIAAREIVFMGDPTDDLP